MVLKNILMQNKKAMVFTILVIAIIVLFLASYTIYSITQNRESVRKRISTLNNFVFSTEKDLSRQLYISGFRIIFLFEERIVETGSYITDLDSRFQEAFLNGTLYQQSEELMLGATFSDIESSIKERAAKINADVTLSSPSLFVTQEDPWNVKIILTTDLLITDSTNLALWNKTINAVTYISVENFEDPLYILNTQGLVTNKINKTPYEIFTYESDVSNLSSHTENSYYIASAEAPSFFDRLQGITTANENGIESLVYLPQLSAQGLIVKDKSVVDYIYFSTNNPLSYYISGMPTWFKLDNEHLDVYNVSHLT